MENIDYLILKKTEGVFKNLDINKYVDYSKLSTNKWNDNFINNYIKNIYNNDYDKLLEKSTQLCSLSYFTIEYIENILKNINVVYSNDYDKSKYYIVYNKEQNNIIIIFRGTNYLSNAIQGLEYYRTKFDFISDEEFGQWKDLCGGA